MLQQPLLFDLNKYTIPHETVHNIFNELSKLWCVYPKNIVSLSEKYKVPCEIILSMLDDTPTEN
jgi:hypothetical protein